MPHGSIIFLNGTSSAGKTSIARALLDITAPPYFHLSVDQFILAIPERYWANSNADARNITFANVISGYHHCIAALAATGNYIIADHVLQEPEWWAECGRLLSPFQAYLITVFCPLDELERREKDRGDREIGLARFQYDRVYGKDIQDFKVDTSLNSASMCAVRIQEHIESGVQPFAFQRISTEGTR